MEASRTGPASVGRRGGHRGEPVDEADDLAAFGARSGAGAQAAQADQRSPSEDGAMAAAGQPVAAAGGRDRADGTHCGRGIGPLLASGST
jgi:hypothetical protein